MSDEKIAKVVDLVKNASKPVRRPRKATPLRPGQTMIINAGGEISGQIAGGNIHNHTHHHAAPQRQPRVTVVPGDDVITEEQKVELTALRDEWITLHNAVKKRPLGYSVAWARINKAGKATSYHRIKPENYELATAYVRRQMALLRGMASAPAKDMKWRSSRIGAIKARCANQLGNPDAYKRYIQKYFGAESLSALATDELQRTYSYIMGKKAG